MNKIVQEQLSKCKTPLPNWNNSTTEMVVGVNSPTTVLSVGSKLKIKIANYIINEPPNFTLSTNWNCGTVPPETVMEVSVIDTLGKMVRVDGVGVTTNKTWSGWLPRKGFEIE